MKTAIVIGATGMVGTQLVSLLIRDIRFQQVIVFARRTTGQKSAKLQEHIVSFDTPEVWKPMVKGDVLFSTLGTTMKQAGSKPAQYKIDYTYQLDFARAASENGVPVYVLVSSSGANPRSRIFYARIKGELEVEVKKLPFASKTILQPGLLAGERKEERIGEKIGFRVLNGLNAIGILKSYRPIHATVVATAMINAATAAKPGSHIYALEEVFSLAEEK